MTDHRLPVYFVSHGGGPWPWIKDLMPADWTALEESLQLIPVEIETTPKAIVCVSAHWETPEFTVQTHPNPPMLYDYGGFPEFTYHIQYPAPGAPEVAERVVELLAGAGIPAQRDGRRGFDHGMFAPLYVSYPQADVPVLQLSIRHDYDTERHLACGRALAPLRDEGVLIYASGFTYHNLRAFGPAASKPSKEFDTWLAEAMLAVDPDERSRRLVRWETAPSARFAHPAEDHLIPLMVAVGAAEGEAAVRIYHEDDFFGGISSSSYRIGATPAETRRASAA